MKERRQEGTLHHVSHTPPIYVNITEGPEGTSGYHIGTDINVSEDLRGSLEKRHANGKSSALPSDTYLLFPINPNRFATTMLGIPIPQLRGGSWRLQSAPVTAEKEVATACQDLHRNFNIPTYLGTFPHFTLHTTRVTCLRDTSIDSQLPVWYVHMTSQSCNQDP
jgi:hypothetical protein